MFFIKECNFNCSKLELIRALNLVSKTLDSFGIDFTESKVMNSTLCILIKLFHSHIIKLNDFRFSRV